MPQIAVTHYAHRDAAGTPSRSVSFFYMLDSKNLPAAPDGQQPVDIKENILNGTIGIKIAF